MTTNAILSSFKTEFSVVLTPLELSSQNLDKSVRLHKCLLRDLSWLTDLVLMRKKFVCMHVRTDNRTFSLALESTQDSSWEHCYPRIPHLNTATNVKHVTNDYPQCLELQTRPQVNRRVEFISWVYTDSLQTLLPTMNAPQTWETPQKLPAQPHSTYSLTPQVSEKMFQAPVWICIEKISSFFHSGPPVTSAPTPTAPQQYSLSPITRGLSP